MPKLILEKEKKIKQDKRMPCVLLELNKWNMVTDIIGLMNDNDITISNLSEFSDELKENVVVSERMIMTSEYTLTSRTSYVKIQSIDHLVYRLCI